MWLRSSLMRTHRCVLHRGLHRMDFDFFGSRLRLLSAGPGVMFFFCSWIRVGFCFYWKNVTGCLLDLYLSGLKQVSDCLNLAMNCYRANMNCYRETVVCLDAKGLSLWEPEYDIFVLRIRIRPKTSSLQLPYQRPSSSADRARELFKGSNGSKKNFWLVSDSMEHEILADTDLETIISTISSAKTWRYETFRSWIFFKKHTLTETRVTSIRLLCCDRKSRAACAQSFAPRQQATIEIMRRNLSYYCFLAPRIYSFVLRAHPVRGASHNQRNTTGEVATVTKYSCQSNIFTITL